MIVKKIPGFDRYIISKNGIIINKKSNKIVKQFINSNGYKCVNLHTDNGQKKYLVHRLIGITYLNNTYFENAQINHKNGIKIDNNVENLEWVTPLENMIHAVQNGLMKRKYTIKKII